MKKSTKLLMTTLLVSLGLAACGGNSTSTSSNQQSLTITTFGELATLDSADYDDVPSSDMLGQIFEGLYRVAKDNKVELGMAAEEPTVSADGLVYTFKLRDAKWSDGTPVTAGDFVFTYRKLVDPKEGHVAQSADVFKNVMACPEQLEPNDLMMASYVFEQAGDKALAEQVRQESLKSVMAIQDVIPESAEEKTEENSTALLESKSE